ncbi:MULTISPECIES: 6-phosphogluconolactonase [Roseobacteraceae]|jgi:6-phosphogluconolactonase|uniref:6-phosphogluconolactonase n=1 Tax=Pseudosulfitobacter pseudonitzschiae TaxID=1402135 RepID=A0A221K082_9RHOB|nr:MULTISPECIES: 6-phosphogluconolactonase [Roseobacteraceae]ASM72406.1 6-phosphogluconolactonase [Pseudosulfitobacter pseudonitzschiae]
MKFEEYLDRDMLAIDVANTMAGALENILFTHERATLVVPGGTSPGPIFDVLSAARLDWDRVDVTLTDERWVDETSDRSNGALLRRRLLVNRAAAATFKPLYREGMDVDAGAATATEGLTPYLPVSVLLLGMGADMHTASLFPGADGLEAALAADAPVALPIHAEGQEPRISLSAQVLDKAMSKHLVIFGAEKRAALERAASLSPQEAPIAAVLDDLTVYWAE